MREKVKTIPDLSLTSNLHLEALKEGKEFFHKPLNVCDRLKHLSQDEIKLHLNKTSNPFAVLFENFINDFNLGTGIRNANGFNAREIFYIGNKKWDRRGSVGSYLYKDVNWLSNIDEVLSLKEKYTIVGVDNVPGSIPMEDFDWQPNTLLVFGEEQCGLTPYIQSVCSSIVHIKMYGSVRSFNCGTSSGIAMYDLVNKLSKKGLLP